MSSVIFFLGALFCMFSGVSTIANASYITHQTYGILVVLVGVIALGFSILFWKLDNVIHREVSNSNDQYHQDEEILNESKSHDESIKNTDDNKIE